LLVSWTGCFLASAASATPSLLGPPPGEGPTIVRIGFFLRDINRIDEEAQRFEFEGMVTLRWMDERQAFDPAEVGAAERVYQGNYQFSEVFDGWWPQLVLANESGHYQRQGVLLRIRPDGSMTYVEEINTVAEVPMTLRRFPFDNQGFEAIFEVLGFDKSEVVLEADSDTTGTAEHRVGISQWRLLGIDSSTREYDPVYADGRIGALSAYVVTFNLKRRPGFMLRVVVIPLALLVVLSWSVFWMDRESLGDRMDISFIGILTIVAYQIMVSGILPRISYFTLMSAFLYISFLTMFAGVVINLLVGQMDRRGRIITGDRIDRRCRWIFPLAYIGLNGLAAGYFFLFH